MAKNRHAEQSKLVAPGKHGKELNSDLRFNNLLEAHRLDMYIRTTAENYSIARQTGFGVLLFPCESVVKRRIKFAEELFLHSRSAAFVGCAST